MRRMPLMGRVVFVEGVGWVLVGVVSFFFVVLWCVRVCFVELEGVGRLTSRSSPVFSSFDIS
jgi:hypothetical protein